MTHEHKLALIWRHTHRDFRGAPGGAKSVLLHRAGIGTCLVPLEALSAAEVERLLPAAELAEQRRLARSAGQAFEGAR